MHIRGRCCDNICWGVSTCLPRAGRDEQSLLASYIFHGAFLRVHHIAHGGLQLGAHRNDLFEEMQETLQQQEDEVAACRAALTELQQNQANGGNAAG